MRISELEKELRNVREAKGDINVMIDDLLAVKIEYDSSVNCAHIKSYK